MKEAKEYIPPPDDGLEYDDRNKGQTISDKERVNFLEEVENVRTRQAGDIEALRTQLLELPETDLNKFAEDAFKETLKKEGSTWTDQVVRDKRAKEYYTSRTKYKVIWSDLYTKKTGKKLLAYSDDIKETKKLDEFILKHVHEIIPDLQTKIKSYEGNTLVKLRENLENVKRLKLQQETERAKLKNIGEKTSDELKSLNRQIDRLTTKLTTTADETAKVQQQLQKAWDNEIRGRANEKPIKAKTKIKLTGAQTREWNMPKATAKTTATFKKITQKNINKFNRKTKSKMNLKLEYEPPRSLRWEYELPAIEENVLDAVLRKHPRLLAFRKAAGSFLGHLFEAVGFLGHILKYVLIPWTSYEWRKEHRERYETHIKNLYYRCLINASTCAESAENARPVFTATKVVKNTTKHLTEGDSMTWSKRMPLTFLTPGCWEAATAVEFMRLELYDDFLQLSKYQTSTETCEGAHVCHQNSFFYSLMDIVFWEFTLELDVWKYPYDSIDQCNSCLKRTQELDEGTQEVIAMVGSKDNHIRTRNTGSANVLEQIKKVEINDCSVCQLCFTDNVLRDASWKVFNQRQESDLDCCRHAGFNDDALKKVYNTKYKCKASYPGVGASLITEELLAKKNERPNDDEKQFAKFPDCPTQR